MTDQMQHLDQCPEVIDQGEAKIRWGSLAQNFVGTTICTAVSSEPYCEVQYTLDKPAGLWRRVR